MTHRSVVAPLRRVLVVHVPKHRVSSELVPEDLGGEPQPSPAGVGSGGGSGLALSAILMTFLFLAAPWFGRRLGPTAELARPPALFSVLERPG
jgi:hypothetical protein